MQINPGLVLVIIGSITLIANGIFGLGSNFGRKKWLYRHFGPATAKVINIAVSLLVISFGILILLRPDLFPNK